MKYKAKLMIKMSLLTLLCGISYGAQPTINASLCLLPDTIIVSINRIEKSDLISIEKKVVPLPEDHATPPNQEERVAFLWKLKEQLEKEITEYEVSDKENDFLAYALIQAKKQLDWEVERGIITHEQAKTTLENIENGNFEKELKEMKERIAHQQKKQESINTIQDTIASAFKAGNINSQQADEMLINLEKGIWDMEKGGVVFDLKKERCE
ncbi:MAG: hypothetical protein LBD11_06090 [Candidatus Peribacteria bacterium]|jgi:hypothetical protein|nr:hypothetical protein [Candidatus Peribacteria bacterium]